MSVVSSSAVTLRETFSFYVPASQIETLVAASWLADAVTVCGPRGPEAIRSLRAEGWDAPVIFDRAGYNPKCKPIPPEQWFAEQSAAGADRLLSRGTWLPWDADGASLAAAVDAEIEACRGCPEATVLFAVEYRWLTKSPMELADALSSLGRPAALVLSHPGDPLGQRGAVDGLKALTSRVNDLSILRTDHGGIGALVYGAQHAAIGLMGAYRHFVPPGKSGGAKRNDYTARVFVPALLDWFTAMTIAGWATTNVDLACRLSCCGGRGLDRFFDPMHEAEADIHNRVALADLADKVLSVPAEERRRYFVQLCADAADRCGPMGKLSMTTTAKPQLIQWALS
jgi:hypothetical protein